MKLGLLASGLAAPSIATGQSRPPNILWISIDDLNDWVGPLGGYSLVRTPNIARLAARGRVYTNAQANVPTCSASRTAVLFGLQPYTTGVYSNDEVWQRDSFLRNKPSLPRYLRGQGYETIGTGKIFHSYLRRELDGTDPAAWDEYQFCADGGECEIRVQGDIAPPRNASNQVVEISQTAKLTPKVGATLDFGPYYQTSQVPDTVRATWMANRVLKVSHAKPFFAACGIIKPHLPYIVPQQFFDLYPASSIFYPPGVLDPTHNTQATNSDVADLGAIGRRMNTTLADHALLVQTGKWKAIVRAYLAAISYADYCVGLLLDGLAAGPNADNTIVVLWGDHGQQLGEKLAWRKFTLWERSLRVPLIISGPGIRAATTGMPVSLIDLYPTVTDLGLGRVPAGLQGRSLKANLQNGTNTHSHAISTWREAAGLANGGPHFSIRNATHRYIRYQSGEKELYDHRTDRYEFTNRLFGGGTAADRRIAAAMDALVPKAPYAPRRGGGGSSESAGDELAG